MLRFLMAPLLLSLALIGPLQAAELTADQQARVDARCQKNPEACERIRARAAELKSQCEADPKRCEEQRAKWKERLEQRRKEHEATPTPTPAN